MLLLGFIWIEVMTDIYVYKLNLKLFKGEYGFNKMDEILQTIFSSVYYLINFSMIWF